MKLPRDLYGRELAAGLCRHWNYRQVNQVGSHIILQIDLPGHHRLSVPDHKPPRVGTLNGILRDVAAAKHTTREAILASV